MSGQIIIGDALTELKKLPDKSVDCCITSPPYYFMRDYDHPDQIGLEPTLEKYVETLLAVFTEVHRVLKDSGTLWLNLGDKYHGSGSSNKKRTDVDKWPKQKRNAGTHTRPKIIDNRQGNPEFDRPCRTKTKRPAKTPPQKGIKHKDLMLVPATVAIALRAWGWRLRNEIIWHKSNPMPESTGDFGGRFTRAHEFIYLFSKKDKYHFDAEAVKEPYAECSIDRLNRAFNANEERGYVGGGKQNLGKYNARMREEMNKEERDHLMRNRRDVWLLPVSTYKGAHFATFSPGVVEISMLAGCPSGGVVLDPFFGSGTVGEVANRLGREWIGIELNDEYLPLIQRRTGQKGLAL